jgi:hypothetical protein
MPTSRVPKTFRLFPVERCLLWYYNISTQETRIEVANLLRRGGSRRVFAGSHGVQERQMARFAFHDSRILDTFAEGKGLRRVAR